MPYATYTRSRRRRRRKLNLVKTVRWLKKMAQGPIYKMVTLKHRALGPSSTDEQFWNVERWGIASDWKTLFEKYRQLVPSANPTAHGEVEDMFVARVGNITDNTTTVGPPATSQADFSMFKCIVNVNTHMEIRNNEPFEVHLKVWFCYPKQKLNFLDDTTLPFQGIKALMEAA